MSLCDDISAATAAILNEWDCREVPGGRLSVTTDRILADGDLVELLVEPDGLGWRVTDAGSALARLTMIDVAVSSRSAARRTAEAIVDDYHLQLAEDVLLGKAVEIGDLPWLLRAVADASVSIDGLRLTRKSPRMDRFSQTVVEDLAHRPGVDVEPRPRVLNRYGGEATFTAQARAQNHQPFLLQAINTHTGDNGQKAAEHAFFQFHGLGSDWPESRRIVIFSDEPTRDLGSRMAEVARIERWSNRDSIPAILARPA